jgi:hypothetical protein
MRRTHVLSISAALVVAASARAQAGDEGFFRFFGNRDIDYWQSGNTVHDALGGGGVVSAPTPAASPQPTPFSGSTVVREADAKPFSWDRYRDPRTPEFWDDGGDWIPPRPFREAAANPTNENVGEYLAWQSRKTAVVAKFQGALTEKALPFSNWMALSVAYFYQAKCSHCIASMATVAEAKSRGVKFTYVQLDYAENAPLHKPSIPYTAQWKKSFPVEATPTWVLKLGERTKALTGEVSLDELAAGAASLQQERRK